MCTKAWSALLSCMYHACVSARSLFSSRMFARAHFVCFLAWGAHARTGVSPSAHSGAMRVDCTPVLHALSLSDVVALEVPPAAPLATTVAALLRALAGRDRADTALHVGVAFSHILELAGLASALLAVDPTATASDHALGPILIESTALRLTVALWRTSDLCLNLLCSPVDDVDVLLLEVPVNSPPEALALLDLCWDKRRAFRTCEVVALAPAAVTLLLTAAYPDTPVLRWWPVGSPDVDLLWASCEFHGAEPLPLALGRAAVSHALRLLTESAAQRDLALVLPDGPTALACELALHRAACSFSCGRRVLPIVIGSHMSWTDALHCHAQVTDGVTCRVFLFATAEHAAGMLRSVSVLIDTGLTTTAPYCPRCHLTALCTGRPSRDVVRAWTGLPAGAPRPAIFCLYTEDAYLRTFPAPSAPSWEGHDITGVLLRMRVLGYLDLMTFPVVCGPRSEPAMRGLDMLWHLGALAPDGSVTNIGHRLVRIPLPTMWARALDAAATLGCSDSVASIAAILLTWPPGARPFDACEDAAEGTAVTPDLFAHSLGGPFSSLNVLHAYHAAVAAGSAAEFCTRHSFSGAALNATVSLRWKLEQVLRTAGLFRTSSAFSDPDHSHRVVRALTAGFFANTAFRRTDGSFCLLEGALPASLCPSCTTAAEAPWVIFLAAHRSEAGQGLVLSHVLAAESLALPALSPTFFSLRRFSDEVTHGAVSLLLRSFIDP